jgi:hypothetical protein
LKFRVAVPSLAVTAGLILTGCGASSKQDTSTPVTVSSSDSGPAVIIETPSDSETDSATLSPTPTPAKVTRPPISRPPISAAACTAQSLRITGSAASGGDSHAGLVIVYTNTGQISCSMTGYPGLAILNAAGKQIIQAARTPSGYLGGIRKGKPPFATVLLDAGGSASALVEGQVVDNTGKTCPTEHALLTTPPGTTVPVKVPATTVFCGQVQIHPIVAGKSSSKG